MVARCPGEIQHIQNPPVGMRIHTSCIFSPRNIRVGKDFLDALATVRVGRNTYPALLVALEQRISNFGNILKRQFETAVILHVHLPRGNPKQKAPHAHAGLSQGENAMRFQFHL